MKIIADSGSTKCDWLVVNDNWEIITHTLTMGYNPYFHDEYLISNDLNKNDFIRENKRLINEVYFYGAGCSSEHYSGIVHRGLSNVFNDAEVAVEHDLMACALAVYQGEPLISCILGTGSNSCHFDGKTIVPGHLSLGFIVGDEASGSYFGKQLLNAFFNKKLPEDLHQDFQTIYNLTHTEFTARVYNSSRANVYLASYMKFFSEKREHPYIQKLLKTGFHDFFDKHICCFDDYKKVKVNFVGSIAYFFQEELEEIAKEYGIKTGVFIQKPVFSLLDFHKSGKILKQA